MTLIVEGREHLQEGETYVEAYSCRDSIHAAGRPAADVKNCGVKNKERSISVWEFLSLTAKKNVNLQSPHINIINSHTSSFFKE
jgi:hypothetical protein